MYLTEKEKKRIELHDRLMVTLYKTNDEIKDSLIQLTEIASTKEVNK